MTVDGGQDRSSCQTARAGADDRHVERMDLG